MPCAARRYHRSERSASYAKRALRFPETADLSSVKAKYENGTLSVEVRAPLPLIWCRKPCVCRTLSLTAFASAIRVTAHMAPVLFYRSLFCTPAARLACRHPVHETCASARDAHGPVNSLRCCNFVISTVLILLRYTVQVPKVEKKEHSRQITIS